MSPLDRPEDPDPEPSERIPAGLLYVPVRSGPAGCTARFFRTPWAVVRPSGSPRRRSSPPPSARNRPASGSPNPRCARSPRPWASAPSPSTRSSPRLRPRPRPTRGRTRSSSRIRPRSSAEELRKRHDHLSHLPPTRQRERPRRRPVRLAPLRPPPARRGRHRRRRLPRRGGRPLRHPRVRAGRAGGPGALPYVPHGVPRGRHRVRGEGVPVPCDGALGAGGGPRPGRVLGRGAGARRHHRVPAGADRDARQREEPRGPAHRAAPRSRPHRRGQHLGDRPAGRDHARRYPPEGHGAGGARHRGRMGTPRSVPVPRTRSSACRSRTAPRSTPSPGYSTSRTSNWSACTATSARRSPP